MLFCRLLSCLSGCLGLCLQYLLALAKPLHFGHFKCEHTLQLYSKALLRILIKTNKNSPGCRLQNLMKFCDNHFLLHICCHLLFGSLECYYFVKSLFAIRADDTCLGPFFDALRAKLVITWIDFSHFPLGTIDVFHAYSAFIYYCLLALNNLIFFCIFDLRRLIFN